MDNLIVEIAFTKFPKKFTCDGENVSPGIRIGRINAPYLAVILNDPDAPGGTFNNWVMWNIEPVEAIPEGIPNEALVTSPISAMQGTNDFGRIGYGGPCPPKGEMHRYFFNVYGLDTVLELPATAKKADLEKAMEGHVLQYGGNVIADYKREG